MEITYIVKLIDLLIINIEIINASWDKNILPFIWFKVNEFNVNFDKLEFRIHCINKDNKIIIINEFYELNNKTFIDYVTFLNKNNPELDKQLKEFNKPFHCIITIKNKDT